jgi:hypothetical protein
MGPAPRSFQLAVQGALNGRLSNAHRGALLSHRPWAMRRTTTPAMCIPKIEVTKATEPSI